MSSPKVPVKPPVKTPAKLNTPPEFGGGSPEIFDPLNLFSGEEGTFYDAVLSEHREFSGGPLVSEGGNVGWVQDISGNNYHWVQNTTAYKPFWDKTDGVYGFNRVMTQPVFSNILNRTVEDYTVWAVGRLTFVGVAVADHFGDTLPYAFFPKTDIIDEGLMGSQTFNAIHIGANLYWILNFDQRPHYSAGRFRDMAGRGCYERLRVGRGIRHNFSPNSPAADFNVVNQKRLILCQHDAGAGTHRVVIPSLGVDTTTGDLTFTPNVRKIDLLKQMWDFPCDTRTRNRGAYTAQAGVIGRVITDQEIAGLQQYAVLNYGVLA
jgi:hypothetical protein